LESETTKNVHLKPQMLEFKTKNADFYQTVINSRNYKVCVSGLSSSRIDIEEFMSQ